MKYKLTHTKIHWFNQLKYKLFGGIAAQMLLFHLCELEPLIYGCDFENYLSKLSANRISYNMENGGILHRILSHETMVSNQWQRIR